MLLFSNKMYENFSTTDALNAVAATEKKVNDVYSEVGDSHVSINKNLALNSKKLFLRANNDSNHEIYWNQDIDGPEIKGNAGISLATSTGGAKRVVEIKKDLVTHNAKIDAKKGIKIPVNDYWKEGGHHDGSGLYFLDRQSNECPKGQFMAGIRWKRHGDEMSTELLCSKFY
jgi:hypothetical protein